MSSLSLEPLSISEDLSIQSESESVLHSPNTASFRQFLFHSMTTELELMKNDLDLLIETADVHQRVMCGLYIHRHPSKEKWTIFIRYLSDIWTKRTMKQS